MGVRYNRALTTDPDALSAGEWAWINGARFVCCKECGAVVRLSVGYLTDGDGRTAPALACRSCPQWEYVALEGYGEAVRE